MKIKKYIVQSMPEAMQQIRADLGSEAMILTTKPISVGGMFGLFKKQRIEVIAGVDTARQQIQPRDISIAERSSPIIDGGNWKRQEGRSEGQTDEEVLKQLAEMKKMMQQFTQQPQTSMRDIEIIQGWINHLLDQGVSSTIIEQVRVHLKEALEVSELSTDEDIRECLRQYWRDRLVISNESTWLNGRVIQFVGPTGVGKTTTMAKMAARQVLKHKQKIGFIAADTYRIAAVEQLRTYASILDIPFKVVHSAHDFKEAVHQFSDLDFILMDTAGRNYQNPLHVSELNSLIAEINNREVVLVLSMTTHYNNMRNIIQNFMPYEVDQILLTKVDETSQYGSIINILEEFKLPIRYIANGQNVPEDLHKFQVNEWIERLLEAKELA